MEERIVQRAQKKLFLDCMVNRGSTAQGQEIDRRLQEARAARAAHLLNATSSEEDNYWPSDDQGVQTKEAKEVQVKKESGVSSVVERDSPVNSTTGTIATNNANTGIKTEEDEDPDHEAPFHPAAPAASTSSKPTSFAEDPNGEEQLDASTVMSALKFGWNACFGADGDAYSISDAALDAIIDRARTCDSAVNALISSEQKTSTSATTSASAKARGKVEKEVPSARSLGLQEGQQSSVTQFEEAAPMVSLRNFEGEMIVKSKTVSCSCFIGCFCYCLFVWCRILTSFHRASLVNLFF